MNQTEAVQASAEQPNPGWRIKTGFTLFILSIAWPVVVPVMPLLGYSGTAIATFSGAMLVIAELMMLAGVAIAGKEGFAYIKAKVFGLLKSYGPPKTVGRSRYTFGLVLFMLPILLGWAGPYFGGYLPGFVENNFTYSVVGDLMLLTSLFVLGGDFWEKLRSLFVHRAYAVIPDKSADASAAH
jgi:hypothetical protein